MQREEDPDAAWLAELSGVSEHRALSALREAQAERSLFRHLERQHRAGGRDSYVEIDAPLELFALVRLLRPLHIVEVGVSSGVSSAYLLQGLERNGRGTLHSVDLPKIDKRAKSGQGRSSWALPFGRSSGWAVPMPLRGRWDLRLGNKKDVIPLLAEELRRIELVLYDVPHDDPGVREEFRGLDARLPSGGVVIVDHGPGGGLCPSLAWWARRRHSTPTGRRGLGLYGFRSNSR